jgi:hypothetical protein
MNATRAVKGVAVSLLGSTYRYGAKDIIRGPKLVAVLDDSVLLARTVMAAIRRRRVLPMLPHFPTCATRRALGGSLRLCRITQMPTPDPRYARPIRPCRTPAYHSAGCHS